ncbi:MAG TPA: amino acid ABC transporter ATP-binding protein [Pyrinomonadaceae bacterium]|jgi:ABC-type polar amino acid transport system ATPase subunit|nr:amino acid ABC transporter ATP-binding protein [Pyrinomonadaceae bacterium]
MIRVEGLGKSAGEARILRGVSFRVEPSTVLGIMGASGSGKTTLLRCLNGLERVTEGAVECEDVRLEAGLAEKEYQRRVRQLRRRVGMVFQHLYLFPHLSVLANITEAPVQVLKKPRREAEQLAHELLEAVGLKQAAPRYPESLSGGEQQRVAIVRALAMRPEVLLFDEPTSALDPRRSFELVAVLRRFVEQGQTMVIVSHSIKFLEGVADFLLYMEGGEAVEFGAKEQVLREPRDPRTRDFLRQTD